MTEVDDTSDDPSGEDRLRRIFEEARQLPRNQIEEFIRQACGDDPEMAAELGDLLEELKTTQG